MATIVTHFSPDLDGLMSIWLLKRFGGLADADLAFVVAGQTIDGLPADHDPAVVHVDTGGGRFDHHQPEVAGPDVCAAKLVWQAVAPQDEALRRMVAYVTAVDNAYPGQRAAAQGPFTLLGLIWGNNMLHPNPAEAVESILPSFDAWYAWNKECVELEHQFVNRIEFQTRWGKALAFEGDQGGSRALAWEHGAIIFVRRTSRGWLEVSARSDAGIDLTPAYLRVREADPAAPWFLHPSKRLLLCGSPKSPIDRPSRLTLRELVDVLRQV
ncbi:MAG: hypothetical protein EPO21_24190 [Chloroflexota bacterium]|nr:MAG: hypothetical protein EPO21_24190 [Chloroflexota bacterium]